MLWVWSTAAVPLTTNSFVLVCDEKQAQYTLGRVKMCHLIDAINNLWPLGKGITRFSLHYCDRCQQLNQMPSHWPSLRALTRLLLTVVDVTNVHINWSELQSSHYQQHGVNLSPTDIYIYIYYEVINHYNIRFCQASLEHPRINDNTLSLTHLQVTIYTLDSGISFWLFSLFQHQYTCMPHTHPHTHTPTHPPH